MSNARLIFFGTESYSAEPLSAFIQSGFSIAAVVTKPDAPSGRGRILTAPPVKLIAAQHNIPVWQPQKVSEIAPQLHELTPTAGILVAYGKIIPPSILGFFPHGILNIHPSLLPKYRGPAPIEAAILNGDHQTGVTLMQLDSGMDTGPAYAQQSVSLTGSESRQELYSTLFGLGTNLLIHHLPAILDSTLKPTPQSTTGVSVTKLIHKSDGIIDWSKPTIQLEREIRAYLGWPGSRTTIKNTDVTITAAHVSDTGAEPLACPTSHGYLVIDRLKPAGKREMTAAEFLAGHR